MSQGSEHEWLRFYVCVYDLDVTMRRKLRDQLCFFAVYTYTYRSMTVMLMLLLYALRVGMAIEQWTGLGPRSFLPRDSRVACTRVNMVINLALHMRMPWLWNCKCSEC